MSMASFSLRGTAELLSPLAREAEAEPQILELQASRLDSLALTGWEVDREGPSVLSLAVVDQCPV